MSSNELYEVSYKYFVVISFFSNKFKTFKGRKPFFNTHPFLVIIFPKKKEKKRKKEKKTAHVQQLNFVINAMKICYQYVNHCIITINYPKLTIKARLSFYLILLWISKTKYVYTHYFIYIFMVEDFKIIIFFFILFHLELQLVWLVTGL